MRLNEIKEHVSTQYGDLTGVIQIDGHLNISSIYKLCNDNGFPTDNIFIVGFGLSEHTITGIGQSDHANCHVLYLEKDQYGNSFDEIEKNIRGKDSITLKKERLSIAYSSLGKYIKRFDFLATNTLLNNVSNIEIEE